MSYICVDIEWNIPNDPNGPMEALSIGAVLAKDEGTISKTFFKYIQPEHKELVTPDTLKLLHAGPVPLMQAAKCAEVMKKFDLAFPTYDTLIVWNRDSLAFLLQTMELCGTSIHTRHIVILQDLLIATCKDVRKGSTIGMRKALRKFDIPHDPNLLHISKYDALYLQKLYCAVSQHLRTTAAENVPLFHTPNSSTLHHAGCRYLNNRPTLSASWEDAIGGAPLCSVCASGGALRAFHGPKKARKAAPRPTDELHRDKKDIPKGKKNCRPIKWAVDQFAEPFDESEVEEYCAKRNIGCTVACHWIFIRTPAAHWRIEHDGHKVLTVYHENLRQPRHTANKGKLKTGFHQQKISSKNVFDVIDYIKAHDQRFLREKSLYADLLRA